LTSIGDGRAVQGNGMRKAKEPHKGGMPRFVPTDEDRALVKLLIANGYAQHVVCQYISNRRGSHISESTLKRAFARELEIGKVELVTKVLTQFMAAIMRGERWAICKYMDQQMWRPEDGGWRARPYELLLMALSRWLPAAAIWLRCR